MEHQPDDAPVTWLRDLLLPWLEQQSWQPAELIGYLQGNGLPPVGHDEEPYVWLLRGLPVGAGRNRAEIELAKRAAAVIGAVLQVRPGEPLPGKRPEQMLYNLLMLCAGLSTPDQLTEPLTDLLKHHLQHDTLRGDWHGLSLSACLRDALIENQLDARFQVFWELLLGLAPQVDEQTASGWGLTSETFAAVAQRRLPGYPPHGFNGALWVHPSNEERSKPVVNVIGKSLKAITTYMEKWVDHYDQWRELFSNYLARIREAYPRVGAEWDKEFVEQAHQFDWPEWALSCVRLNFPVPQSPCGFYLWKPVVVLLGQRYPHEVQNTFCKGQVVQVCIKDPETLSFVSHVAPEFEKIRLGSNLTGPGASKAEAVHALSDLELNLNNPGFTKTPTLDTLDTSKALEALHEMHRKCIPQYTQAAAG